MHEPKTVPAGSNQHLKFRIVQSAQLDLDYRRTAAGAVQRLNWFSDRFHGFLGLQ